MIAAGVWAWFRLGQTYPRRASLLLVAMTFGALASIYFPSNVLAYYYAFLAPFAVLLAAGDEQRRPADCAAAPPRLLPPRGPRGQQLTRAAGRRC